MTESEDVRRVNNLALKAPCARGAFFYPSISSEGLQPQNVDPFQGFPSISSSCVYRKYLTIQHSCIKITTSKTPSEGRRGREDVSAGPDKWVTRIGSCRKTRRMLPRLSMEDGANALHSSSHTPVSRQEEEKERNENRNRDSTDTGDQNRKQEIYII